MVPPGRGPVYPQVSMVPRHALTLGVWIPMVGVFHPGIFSERRGCWWEDKEGGAMVALPCLELVLVKIRAGAFTFFLTFQ